MVDNAVLARKVAAIRDAVKRLQDMLPPTVEEFISDRTAREVVTFNLFLALQDAITLAAHWLADEGVEVPESYGGLFASLGSAGVLEAALAERLRAAVGLRNLVAHQYGVLDFSRVFHIARDNAQDLLAFCEQVSRRAGDADTPPLQ
ncbi:MAG: HepT-like ribonuclease domain-containing protein [Vicinamibacterales bacterium]